MSTKKWVDGKKGTKLQSTILTYTCQLAVNVTTMKPLSAIRRMRLLVLWHFALHVRTQSWQSFETFAKKVASQRFCELFSKIPAVDVTVDDNVTCFEPNWLIVSVRCDWQTANKICQQKKPPSSRRIKACKNHVLPPWRGQIPVELHWEFLPGIFKLAPNWFWWHSCILGAKIGPAHTQSGRSHGELVFDRCDCWFKQN